VSDERPHGEGSSREGRPDEAVPLDQNEGGRPPDPATPEPAPDEPSTPPRLPSAASFFGEPRAPRHSAHVDSPMSAPSDVPVAEPRPVDGSSEQDPTATGDGPAVPFYVPPPAPEPASPAAPHPQALDLSALQGGADLLPSADVPSPAGRPSPAPWHLGEDTASLDARELPPHDEPGETPTAAFGALFGDVPTAGTPVAPPQPDPVSEAPSPSDAPAPAADDPSFTELISMPPAAAAPASFDWNDLPAPRTTEIDLPHAAAPIVEPAPDGETPAVVTSADVPAAVVPAAVEAPAVEPRDVAPAEEAPAVERAAPASTWDDDPATQALPRVWSLDDDEPRSATTGPATSSPVWSLSDDDGEPTEGPASADTAPPTDPFLALFGDAVESDAEEAPVATRAAESDSDSAPDEAAAAGADGGWADEPRAPIPPALDEPDAAPATEPAAETVAFTPSESDPTPIPSLEPAERPTVVDAPTVAFESPTRVLPPVVPGGDDPDPATPSRFAQQPGTYRGPSSRPQMPIDASKAPASWVAAAAQAQVPSSAPPSGASTVSPAPGAPAFAPVPVPHPAGGGGFGEWSQNRRILVFAGIGLGFVLILVALFFLGQAIRSNAAAPVAAAPTTSAAATPTASSTPTPTPTPTSVPTASTPPVASGPAAPGTRAWSDLQGGECLGSFTNAWQSTYQVVDCSTTHPAQMVAKGTVSGTGYPGFAAVGAQVGPLCQSSSVIDFSKAQAYDDVQISASYPATQAQWDSGDHSYYCFVSRSSGQAITGSVKAGS
jgi:hypothetical protein